MHQIRKPVHTYSIVAREKATGQLGVACQSHYFSVGSVVPWVQQGVGAVATQADIDVSYGPLGLDLMRAGKTAEEALKALLAVDDDRDIRQVAMVDAAGEVAVHTGSKCIPAASHRTGDGFSVQANLVVGDEVPDAMAKTFEQTKGDLLERLMTALEAGEEAGGDVRGRQSAAILIAPGPDESPPGHAHMLADLRVDDEKQPLLAMRRLVTVYRGQRWEEEATEAVLSGNMDAAGELYEKFRGLAVGSREPMFWYAITLVNEGHVNRALPIFGEVFVHDKIWIDVLDRLVKVGRFPDDAKLLKQVKAMAEPAKTG
jgi:uncharacterized Ntn-hydrolase superfamily protein